MIPLFENSDGGAYPWKASTGNLLLDSIEEVSVFENSYGVSFLEGLDWEPCVWKFLWGAHSWNASIGAPLLEILCWDPCDGKFVCGAHP